jgi:uncharacterized protein (TIGR04255 family)
MTKKIEFTNPPVTEVALGIQFTPIPQLNSALVGLFWSGLRSSFPGFQEQPPLFPITEKFGEDGQQGMQAAVGFGPMPTRVWLLSESGSELIQIQPDRFIFNWRRVPGDDSEYPRYESVRENFDTYFAKLRNAIEAEGGQIDPQQCEVIYINHIVANGVWQRHGQLENIVAAWSGRHSDTFLAEPEAVQIQERQVIKSADGNPIGRLYISAEPAFRASDRRPTVVITLTARGAPLSEGIAGAQAFLDVGHDYVVQGFASFTTRAAHKEWGRQ